MPTTPFGSVVVEIKSPCTMVSVRLTDLVWAGFPASVTWNVRGVALTVAVGVPVMAPVEALSESPVGSVPAVSDQV